jgi:hypothetical protein
MDEYLPLSRPAARGEQSSRNMGLLFVTMLGMLAVVGGSYLAWSFGFLWVLIVVELAFAGLVNWSFCRVIRNRRLVPGDGDSDGFARRQLQ